MASIAWFEPRGYQHLDRPASTKFARKAMNPAFVCKHSFSPLIFYEKIEKRYKKAVRKTEIKKRPIMYASHRDACILSYYSSQLAERLEAFYEAKGLSSVVAAYRATGKANIDFSAEAYHYAVQNAPVTILAFDVSGFFDNLDHKLLKIRLKRLLDCQELSDDWYKVFRFVTKFHFVEKDELKSHAHLAERLKARRREPICTISELKELGIPINKNKNGNAGIPQGTPISASFSNLYMIDFDEEMKKYCDDRGIFYRRYSDDILLICREHQVADLNRFVVSLINDQKLDISAHKTEVSFFHSKEVGTVGDRAAQYLGFSYHAGGVGIRARSLSRQWRKMRRAIRRIEKIGKSNVASGKSVKIYTKTLRRRFSPLQFRNFSSYARRSAKRFGEGEKITRQVRRLEREFERLVKRL